MGRWAARRLKGLRPAGGAMLPDVTRTECYLLGSRVPNGVLASARAAQLDQTWVLDIVFATSAVSDVNEVLNGCFERSTGCRTGQVAMVLDGVVLAAPVVQAKDLASNPNGIQIAVAADLFGERDVKDLAAVLGSDPLPLKVSSAAS